MKGPLICLMSKSALPRSGRIGPEHLQDWYRGCIKAIKLARKLNGKIFIPTAFASQGENEADFYALVFKDLGAKEGEVTTVQLGFETIEQLNVALETAERAGRSLIIVSSILHFPRVLWLTRMENVTHRVIIGIPRPKEALTDLALMVLFPIIDILGLRKKFLAYMKKRRLDGKV